MCGICGVVETERRPVDREGLSRMCASLAHRGPDDTGQRICGPVGLGQRRLSIIDLEGGRQPLSNEDGSVWISFNGEIYNYRELRAELETGGHRFRTNSDTEAIVHLYEEFGDDCVQRLRGMFAFAIHDERRGRVLLARDRFGIKPLFYATQGGRLLFGSEIKALFAYDPSLADPLDTQALALAFTFPYIPAPRTAFLNVKKLLPAHTLAWENGRAGLQRYWDIAAIREQPIREAQALERLDALLEDAVRSHLVADVPLGAFLSGGVDSSTVVAMMTRSAGRRVKTFSITFAESSHDESPYARRVAAHLGTEHIELRAVPEAVGLVDRLAAHFDEPFFDSSAIPTYLASGLAREHVTVILTGDGGDELFGGYAHYLKYRGVMAVRQLPAALRKRLAAAASLAPPASRAASLRRLMERSLLPFPERYWRAFAWPVEANRLVLSPDLLAGRDLDGAFAHIGFHHDGDLRDAFLFDIHSLLPDDFLTKVDRMSMAHALETRVPLLDHHLAEFAASLPLALKVRGLTTKYLLKKQAARLVPPETVYRPKRGFSVPLARWFREDLRDEIRDRLLDPNAASRPYLNRDGVAKIIALHQSGAANWHDLLWSLLFFETWLSGLTRAGKPA